MAATVPKIMETNAAINPMISVFHNALKVNGERLPEIARCIV
jgi:hypothetical protein